VGAQKFITWGFTNPIPFGGFETLLQVVKWLMDGFMVGSGIAG